MEAARHASLGYFVDCDWCIYDFVGCRVGDVEASITQATNSDELVAHLGKLAIGAMSSTAQQSHNRRSLHRSRQIDYSKRVSLTAEDVIRSRAQRLSGSDFSIPATDSTLKSTRERGSRTRKSSLIKDAERKPAVQTQLSRNEHLQHKKASQAREPRKNTRRTNSSSPVFDRTHENFATTKSKRQSFRRPYRLPDNEAETETEHFVDAPEFPSEQVAISSPKKLSFEQRGYDLRSKIEGLEPESQPLVSRKVSKMHDAQLLAINAKERSARMSKLTSSDVFQSTDEMFEDISVVRRALHLFLNSRMTEAYEMIEPHSERRLYYAVGFALLSSIKAIMTFEHQDLGTAISHCKDALHVASLLRKKTSAFTSIGRFVRGSGASVSWLSSMTPLEKHAELSSSECTLVKAVLGIAHSGDFLGSLSEALHLRAVYGEYRSLLKFIDWEDSNGGEKSDEDFRSGIYLGSGCISLILGLLPSRVLKIMEIFGYEGSVPVGLELLSKSSGWSSDSSESLPKHDVQTEGIRSPICDMAMLTYHLVISTFIPVPRVDINFSEKVLNYHLQRYPHGVFFLYFHGRLYSTQARTVKAIECFKEARDVQEEYIQLKHICYWDMALCYMSLCEWHQTHECFNVLANENNWSKALYHYACAAALYETGTPAQQEEAKEIMERVPSMSQRIAGKSIPLEKFAARKSRKMTRYGYLFHPAMEFAYLTHCYTNSPPKALFRRFLPIVKQELERLTSQVTPVLDDLCLAHFLHGVILRNLAYPEKHVHLASSREYVPREQAASMAEESLMLVAKKGASCEYDHYMLYFCHYELGRLYISMGRYAEAREQLDMVLSGKNLGDHGRKGKYSMQNMCVLRSNGALEMLQSKSQT